MGDNEAEDRVPLKCAAGTTELEDAFTKMWNDGNERKKVFSAANRRIRCFCHVAAGRTEEDLIQDAWLTLWKGACGVDAGDADADGRRWDKVRYPIFRPVFVRTISYVFRDWYRASKPVVSLEALSPAQFSDGNSTAASIERRLVDEASLDTLERDMAHLPNTLCVVRGLRGDLSTKEILERCSIAIAAFYNAKKNIENWVKRKFEHVTRRRRSALPPPPARRPR